MKFKTIIKQNNEFLIKNKNYFIFTLLLFFTFFFIGMMYPSFFMAYQNKLLNNPFVGSFLATFLFLIFNNASTAFLGMFTGFLFGIIPTFLIMLNGYVIGAIFGRALEQMSTFEVLVRFIPHGFFELPAIIISLGFGLVYYGVMIKHSKEDTKLEIKKYFRQAADVFFMLLLPLLFVSALIESILIANMAKISKIIFEPRIKIFIFSMLMAYLFYGVLKSLLSYLEKRESKQIVLLAFFLLLASDIWMVAYGHIVKEFLDKFSLLTNLLPLILILGYLYFEHRKYLEEKDKKVIKGAFSQYVTPKLINEIMKDPEKLKLGGEKKELTVFFSDIRGFTSISEKLTPTQLVHLLNEYLTVMTDVVLENKGVVDKYMGDAIMAFWNAPVDTPDHAHLACKTSLKMMRELAKFNEKVKKEGLPLIDIGIGLNTGPMVVGNMGSEKRFDYTVMGDAVNLGSRLEGLNKPYGTKIIISEFTYDVVKNEYISRKLDFVKVKGKNEPVTIYELRNHKDYTDKEELSLIENFEKALTLYKDQNFTEAKNIFLTLYQKHNDFASNLFVERCDIFLKESPSEDWDGAWVMKTK